jgi:hypothetical protein
MENVKVWYYSEMCLNQVSSGSTFVLRLWCLRHFQNYFSYIMAVSFNGGGKRSTRRKPPTFYSNLVHTTRFWNYLVSSNPAIGDVYSIQHYVIKFVSDLRQNDGFLRILLFPPPIKLATTYNWNIVESDVK